MWTRPHRGSGRLALALGSKWTFGFVLFGLFALATLVALAFGAYLIGGLKAFPEEYRKAGSPSVAWIDGRYWSFLWYVLKGRFEAIPDASLVATFKAYRALEAVRLLLVVALVLTGLADDILSPKSH